MNNIPNKANKDRLKITALMQRPNFAAKFKPSGSQKGSDSWKDVVLQLQESAIDGSGSDAT
jgi:hypothetical protein